MIDTFVKFRINRTNPTVPTCLVVSTYTLPINAKGADMAIKHTRHRFRNIYPRNLTTAYNTKIIITHGSGKIERNEPIPCAATASTRRLSCSAVHGVDPSGAIVGRGGRKGRQRSERKGGKGGGIVYSTVVKMKVSGPSLV